MRILSVVRDANDDCIMELVETGECNIQFTRLLEMFICKTK